MAVTITVGNILKGEIFLLKIKEYYIGNTEGL